MRREVAVESTAEAYLEILAARGIGLLFCQRRHRFRPHVEAYASAWRVSCRFPNL